MNPLGISFEVTYQQQQVKVEVFTLGKETLFRIYYPAGQAFFITKASAQSSNPFWTSIPEGKQGLAEKFGELVDEHYIQSTSRKPNPTVNQTPPPKPPTLF
jgi:hypothetical protein